MARTPKAIPKLKEEKERVKLYDTDDMVEVKPVKYKVTDSDLIMLEKALCLRATTAFEENLLTNITTRLKEYGRAVVITERQRTVLEELANRFDLTYQFGRKL